MILLYLFLIQISYSFLFNLVRVFDTYNTTTDDDLISCVTNASNITNIIVYLNTITSSGNFLCIVDETGFAAINLIEINTNETDKIFPGNTSQYIIAQNFVTACFSSIFDSETPDNNRWIERKF